MFAPSKMFSLCAVLAVLGAVVPQDTVAPYSLAIKARQNVVKVGSEVRVKISLTNTSNHEIVVSREKGNALGELDYKVDVRDETGGLARKTKYLRAIQGENTGETTVTVSSPGLFSVQPGKSLEEEDVVVSNLYDLSKPGKYAIQVERTDETSKTAVKSNTITITVTL